MITEKELKFILQEVKAQLTPCHLIDVVRGL